MPQYLSVTQFAKEVNYSERHIRRMIKQGRIKAFRSEGMRKWLIPQSEIAALQGTPTAPTQERELRNSAKKEDDPIITKRRAEHYEHLAAIASVIWSPTLNCLPRDITASTNEPDDFDYLVGDYDEPEYLTTQELNDMLQGNLEQAFQQYGIWELECFGEHLQETYLKAKAKSLSTAIKDDPYGLIQHLRILAQGKVFKGTCPVCKDWH